MLIFAGANLQNIKVNIKKDTSIFLGTILKGIEKIKGEEVVILDLGNHIKNVCDYFIICTANSSTQASAIGKEIERSVSKKLHQNPYSIEGTSHAEWILIDYIDVVVHIFQKHLRDFYNLEGMWADARKLSCNNLINNIEEGKKAHE